MPFMNICSVIFLMGIKIRIKMKIEQTKNAQAALIYLQFCPPYSKYLNESHTRQPIFQG